MLLVNLLLLFSQMDTMHEENSSRRTGGSVWTVEWCAAYLVDHEKRMYQTTAQEAGTARDRPRSK